MERPEKFIVGIDIGGTGCKFGLFTPDGRLTAKWKIPTDRSDSGANVVRNAADSVIGRLASMGLGTDALAAAGAGVPGSVSEDGIVRDSSNIRWTELDLRSELSALLGGVPAAVCNDANAAALGELWKGAAQGFTDMLMLTLGTGVGGAVISGGRLINGAHGMGGEFGHMTVSRNETRRCSCGKYGCLEQYVSAKGIARRAAAAVRRAEVPDPLLPPPEEINCADVFRAAKAGSEIARRVAERTGDTIGFALAQLVMTTDPQIVIIGGGVSYAGASLLLPVRRKYKKYVIKALSDIPIELAALHNDAGIYGAARLALDLPEAQ